MEATLEQLAAQAGHSFKLGQQALGFAMSSRADAGALILTARQRFTNPREWRNWLAEFVNIPDGELASCIREAKRVARARHEKTAQVARLIADLRRNKEQGGI